MRPPSLRVPGRAWLNVLPFEFSRPRRRVWVPIGAGLLGGLALAAVYLGIVSIAESPQHAAELFWEDRGLVLPILVTFAIQVGLYIRVRLGPVGVASGAGASAAGGGMSTVAMVACCAHHVTDLLPIVGVSLAATFLAAWKTPLMVLGLAINLAGIAWMLVVLRREGQPARPASTS